MTKSSQRQCCTSVASHLQGRWGLHMPSLRGVWGALYLLVSYMVPSASLYSRSLVQSCIVMASHVIQPLVQDIQFRFMFIQGPLFQYTLVYSCHSQSSHVYIGLQLQSHLYPLVALFRSRAPYLSKDGLPFLEGPDLYVYVVRPSPVTRARLDMLGLPDIQGPISLVDSILVQSCQGQPCLVKSSVSSQVWIQWSLLDQASLFQACLDILVSISVLQSIVGLQLLVQDGALQSS